jgi:molybdopterin-synthase adenylyltransferase
LDTLAARRELVAATRAAGEPLVHGAVSGGCGQVTTILPQGLASADWLFPAAASSQPEPVPGVLAPIVALTASLQAMEACRLLLGEPPAYHGILAHFDGDTGRLETLPLA